MEVLPDMSRANESVTRVDVRFSNEMYQEIQQLAIRDGARTHHISQKVEVSPTIVKLVQLGLDALNGKLPDSDGSIPDILPDKLSGKKDTVSDIDVAVSDKVTRELIQSINIERERIDVLLRKLTAKGIIDPIDIPTDNLSQLPDNIKIISDTLSVKDDVVSDIDSDLSDNLPDNNVSRSGKERLSEKIPDKGEVIPDSIESLSETLTGKHDIISDMNDNLSDSLPDKDSGIEGGEILPTLNPQSIVESEAIVDPLIPEKKTRKKRAGSIPTSPIE